MDSGSVGGTTTTPMSDAPARTVVEAVLFPATRSMSLALAIETVLTTGPAIVGRNARMIVAEAFGAMGSRVTVVPSDEMLPEVVEEAVGSYESPTGTRSVSTGALAMEGPLLVTTIV